MVRYYAMMDQSLHGPLEAATLLALPNFSRRTLVQGQERFNSDYSRWTEAGEVPLLAMLMDTRDRGATYARSAAALDAFSAARRADERDAAALKRDVVEGVAAQRAAMEGVRDELARIAVRIADVETGLKGIKTAIWFGTVVVGLIGLALLARPGVSGRPDPGAQPIPKREAAMPAPAAKLPASAPLKEEPAKPSRAVAPPQKPVAAKPQAKVREPKEEESDAVELVRSFLIPSPPADRCPRTLEEALEDSGTAARTPQEVVDCRAIARILALRDALAARRRWSAIKALKRIRGAMSDMGGFEAAFPAKTAALRMKGKAYEVTIGRSDMLTRRLSALFDSRLPIDANPPLRYLADLATGSVLPRPSSNPKPAPATRAAEVRSKATVEEF